MSPTRTEQMNEKLRLALLNMQQEISSLEKRLNLVEQITVNQRRKQLEHNHQFMVNYNLLVSLFIVHIIMTCYCVSIESYLPSFVEMVAIP